MLISGKSNNSSTIYKWNNYDNTNTFNYKDILLLVIKNKQENERGNVLKTICYRSTCISVDYVSTCDWAV